MKRLPVVRVAGRIVLILVVLGAAGCGGKVTPLTADPSLSTDLPEMEFAATDWPFWRGLTGNGYAEGEFEFSPQGPPPLRWKSPLNYPGHASPIVHGDAIYIAGADTGNELQYLQALDRASGQVRWERKLHEGGFMRVHPTNSQASATPACDGQRVFAVCMVQGGIWLTAVDLAGEQLWQKQVGPFRSMHGYGSSPILHKSLVIVAGDNSGGGFVTAVHRETGEIVWRIRRTSSPSFCTPVVATVGGRDQLLMSGHNHVHSYDPTTGKELWSSAGPAKTTANTLVWNQQLVFASGGYPERNLMAIKADASGEVVWKIKKKIYVPSMLVVGDLLFAIRDDGIAHCFDASSGKEHWKQRLKGNFTASPVLVGDRIVAVAEGGRVHVFRAADKYEQLAQFSVGERCMATPVVAGGELLIRTGKHLICYGSAK